VNLKELGDGRYELKVEDTKVPGTYRFFITLDTKTPKGEILRRIETVEAKVEVIPDGKSSLITSERAADGSHVIRVVPRDEFGNFKGPGYDEQVSVRIDGPGKLESVTDQGVIGDYLVKLVGLKDETPVTVVVSNSVVAKGPVLKLEPVPRSEGQINPPGGGASGKPTKTCGHCGAAGGDVFLLLALPTLVLLSRRRARRQ
jgi:hypothetical protein